MIDPLFTSTYCATNPKLDRNMQRFIINLWSTSLLSYVITNRNYKIEITKMNIIKLLFCKKEATIKRLYHLHHLLSLYSSNKK